MEWRTHRTKTTMKIKNYTSEWGNVRMMHLITALAGRGWHIPKNVTMRAERYN